MRPRTRRTSPGAVGDAWLLATLWRLVRGERRARAQGALAARPAAPLPGPRVADVRRAGRSPPRRRSRRPTWPGTRSTTGSRRATSSALTLIVVAFLVSALVYWARDLRADLPGRLGRPARAAGPARADLRPPAGDVDRLLHPRAGPGVLISRMTNDVAGARPAGHRRRRDAVLEHADAGRRGRDPARARRRSWRWSRSSPSRCSRSAASSSGSSSAGAYRLTRERIADDHRLPAGDAVAASASCGASARSRATSSGWPSSTRRTARRT